MASRRRNRKRDKSEEDSPRMSSTSRSQTGAALAGAISGHPPLDHEMTVLGVGNIARYFDLEDPSNGPSLIFRSVEPMSAFHEGWSNGEITLADPNAATNHAETNVNRALFYITRYAESFEYDVWPVLATMFSSGTGYRASISMSSFVRYMAMLEWAYLRLYNVLVINGLTYHFAWEKVAPFTPTVPAYLYELASHFDATDEGIARRWLPLMKRMETKIIFPYILENIKRMMTPMFSIDLNGRVQVPVAYNLEALGPGTASALEAAIEAKLDYIDVELAEQSAVIKSFLPFPMIDQQPWMYAPEPVIDPNRDSGLFNSGVEKFEAFGKSGDPDNYSALVFTPDDQDQVVYYTRHSQPTWAEVGLTTIWEEYPDTFDDTWAILTPHKYRNAYMWDDVGELLQYDGSLYIPSDNEERYEAFVNTRYPHNQLLFGKMAPGYIGANFGRLAIIRMVRLQCQADWSVGILKAISATMSGASLRELSMVIRDTVMSSFSQGR